MGAHTFPMKTLAELFYPYLEDKKMKKKFSRRNTKLAKLKINSLLYPNYIVRLSYKLLCQGSNMLEKYINHKILT